ncbi:low molecular weight protein arginine phosphatase [Priestia megaterium]|nr:low molecular weight protein arginine phosphatase [Priestia megaterium]
MNNILFVCTGNTCRSPIAAALLRARNIEGIDVKSAGLFAGEGQSASNHAQTVLKNYGVSFSHSSSQITNEDLQWATYILTMTNQHKSLIISQAPEVAHKTFTLKEFAGQEGDITDPFGGSIQVYQHTLEEIEALINKMIKKLK